MQQKPSKPPNSTSAGSLARELGWLAAACEDAQRVRSEAENEILAATPRANAAGAEKAATNAHGLLERIRTGSAGAAGSFLARRYRHQWRQEQQLRRALEKRLDIHPAWRWLKQVEGIDPILAGELLARLDPTRAATPSAFWAYCGFATVPGTEFRCSCCGYKVALPGTPDAPVSHRRPGGDRPCSGTLERYRGPEQGVRVAQPKAVDGEPAAYDRRAKKVCYLIGIALLNADGAYARVYHEERARLDRQRKGWPAARKHMAALRKMEKLFLAHLWLTWRQALDLPVTEPYSSGSGNQVMILSLDR